MTRTHGRNSEAQVTVTAPDDDVARLPVTETRGGENPGDWVVAYDENGVFTLDKGGENTE
jgi:hypothetical protein